MKKFFLKYLNLALIAATAMAMSVPNFGCGMFIHQPKVPAKLREIE